MGLLSTGISYLDKQNQISTAEKFCCTFSVYTDSNTQLFSVPFNKLHEMLNGHGVLQFGLFVPFNNKYYLVFNHGYNFETTLQSESSKNFWLGSIGEIPEENTWYQQTASNLESFLQLFSLEDRENIKMLNFKFCQIGKISNCIVIATQPNTHELVTDHILDSIDDNWQFFEDILKIITEKYIEAKNIEETDRLIDDKDDIFEHCLSDDLKGNMISINLHCFIDELIIHNTRADSFIMTYFLFSELKKAMEETSICVRVSNECIKIISFSHFKTNIELYKEKIFFQLKPFFEEPILEKLIISNAGIAKDTENFYRFISAAEN